jgi:hypothetical protein
VGERGIEQRRVGKSIADPLFERAIAAAAATAGILLSVCYCGGSRRLGGLRGRRLLRSDN